MQLVIFMLVPVDLSIQLLKIGDDKWVDHFYIFIVLSCEMVLHQCDLLSQKINFLFIVPHVSHGLINNPFH